MHFKRLTQAFRKIFVLINNHCCYFFLTIRTGNLLSYLNELEKDIHGKKYGLVFEEHRETIDDILKTHASTN